METNYQDYREILGRRLSFDRRVLADHDYKGIERRIKGERRKETLKRKYERYRAKDLTFVKLMSKSDVDIGQLLDISKGGLSLRYFINAEKSHDYSELGIFMSGDNFKIDHIPFRIVSDTILSSIPTFSKIILRRYGVQFENLTPKQAAKLDHFLLSRTLSEA